MRTLGLLFLIALGGIPSPAFGQSSQIMNLSPVLFTQGTPVTLGASWKYHPGDNIVWAEAEFDDTGWEAASPQLARDSMPPGGWHGIGWFRLRLDVDSTMAGTALALLFYNVGVADLYLDGDLLYSFGPGNPNVPHVLVLTQRRHILAVRYRIDDVEALHTMGVAH